MTGFRTKITDLLDQRQIAYRILPHSKLVFTVEAAAAQRGVVKEEMVQDDQNKRIFEGGFIMPVSPDLLAILRCPYCVSGPTRKPGNDPGRLTLVRDSWLICQEPDCDRKYPIKEDIPVMLIDEGDKWANTAIEDLPEPGNLVDSSFSVPAGPILETGPNRQFWLGLVLGLTGMLLIAMSFIWLFRRRT